jgi:hypothetical protein
MREEMKILSLLVAVLFFACFSLLYLFIRLRWVTVRSSIPPEALARAYDEYEELKRSGTRPSQLALRRVLNAQRFR